MSKSTPAFFSEPDSKVIPQAIEFPVCTGADLRSKNSTSRANAFSDGQLVIIFEAGRDSYINCVLQLSLFDYTHF